MNQPVAFVMGVSGSGKTTVGKLVSSGTGIPFFDADDYHPAANIEKMKGGIALTDEDRLPWLQRLNELALSATIDKGAVIACSALKEKYRQLLSNGLTNYQWIFLQGDFGLIQQRLKERPGHFMPPSLLRSQFEALEIPAEAVTIDIHQSPEKIAQQIIRSLHG